MIRVFVVFAMVVLVSPYASAVENAAAFGGVTKAMFEEVRSYKTIGEFNDRFLPMIDDTKTRKNYEEVLAPKSGEPMPAIVVMSDKSGFTIVHDGKPVEFVLVSAKEFKWTVNGVEWKVSKRFGDPKNLASLDAILNPKKGALIRALVPEANAQEGRGAIEIMKRVPILGVPIGYIAGMLEHSGECMTRANFNRWTPMPFAALEMIAVAPVCGVLATVWPLALVADRKGDPLGIKNLPDTIGGIPRLTCPQDNPQRELKIEFLTTESLSDRVVFTSYRWQHPPRSTAKPSSLLVTNSTGTSTMSYPAGRNHTMLRTSSGRSIRMDHLAVNVTSIAHSRFSEVCNDPKKRREYQARFVAQERKINRDYGTEAAEAHAGSVVPTPTAAPRRTSN